MEQTVAWVIYILAFVALFLIVGIVELWVTQRRIGKSIGRFCAIIIGSFLGHQLCNYSSHLFMVAEMKIEVLTEENMMPDAPNLFSGLIVFGIPTVICGIICGSWLAQNRRASRG